MNVYCNPLTHNNEIKSIMFARVMAMGAFLNCSVCSCDDFLRKIPAYRTKT